MIAAWLVVMLQRLHMRLENADRLQADVFPDGLPWLYVGGSADALPWAARHLD
jgi:hypothetical protein